MSTNAADVPHHALICWKPSPTRADRCDRKAGHDGPHTWEAMESLARMAARQIGAGSMDIILAVQHLERLLKQHEDYSQARLVALTGTVDGLAQLIDRLAFQGTVKVRSAVVATLELRALDPPGPLTLEARP